MNQQYSGQSRDPQMWGFSLGNDSRRVGAVSPGLLHEGALDVARVWYLDPQQQKPTSR